MSRYDGWLVRYIVMNDTPAALSLKKAAKSACVRIEVFAKALAAPHLVRLDAQHLGIDPEEMRAIRDWNRRCEAEAEVEESMLQSAASVTRHPPSEKYRGSSTRLGVTRPNPPSAHRDHLNLPINPIEHPEPQGEWHAGLDAAGPRRK